MILTREIVDKDIEMMLKMSTEGEYLPAFHEYGKLYPYTNENLSIINNLINFNGNILIVTASGDQGLNAVLNGATKVTSLDINHLAKYFAELKVQAVKKLDYDDFCKLYKLEYKDGKFIYDDFLQEIDPNLFCDACDDMDPLFKCFLEEYFVFSYTKDMRYLFSMNNNPNNNLYLKDEQSYYSLQEKLKSVEISYIECELLDLPNLIGNDIYSAMLFSNITSHYSHGELKKALKMCHILSKNLLKDGIIQFGYGDKKGTPLRGLMGGNRVDKHFVDKNKKYLYDVEQADKAITFYKSNK